MADETTTTATASDVSTAQGGQTQPPAQPGSQAQAPQATNPPAVDIEKELQRIKSQMGREAAEARRAAQAAQDRAAAAERQIREQRLAGMDDLERSKFERDEAYAYARSVEQQAQVGQQNIQRERDIADLMAEYGAPREVFDEATDYTDAIKRARAYEKRNREKQIEETVTKRLQKAEANSVDLGGGAPSTPVTRQEEKYREAWRKKDAKSYVLEILSSRN